MIKKIIALLWVALFVVALAVAPAYAKQGRGNVKGQVESVNLLLGTLAVKTVQGDTVLVHLPAGFDAASLQVGDTILVKGRLQPDGSILADSIKPVKVETGEGLAQQGDGSKANNAFCMAGKQEKPHPMAVKISERFGVTQDWVMDYFCNGQSMGAILLALKTHQVNPAMDPELLLALKAEGKGWGQIWKDAGLIGNEKEANSPPGQLKKNDDNSGNPNPGSKKNK